MFFITCSNRHEKYSETISHRVLYENNITFLKQGVLNSLNSLQKV